MNSSSSSSSSSSAAVGLKRLQKEYIAIQKQPVENITARPDDKNIFEWHYCIKGPDDSSYKDGYYYGLLRFPPEYPFKPPSIMMITPNGRFKTNTRLCLSMSDFHPETWNPMWSVSSILSGLLSFMLDEAPTHGSMTATNEQRQLLAKASMESNMKNKIFVKMFPEIIDEYMKKSRNSRGESLMEDTNDDNSKTTAAVTTTMKDGGQDVTDVHHESTTVNNMERKNENESANHIKPQHDHETREERRYKSSGNGKYFTVLLISLGVAAVSYIWHNQFLLSPSSFYSNLNITA